MKIQTECVDWVQRYLTSLKITSFLVLILATSTSSRSTKCPFSHVFHLGDGFSDNGNSVRILPLGPSLPPTRLPYGVTFPGRPTGRWSDGLVNSDLVARDLGLPKIAPYLSLNTTSLDGVIFSVAQSPALDREFFTSRGIDVPPYVVSLRTQLKWFQSYLESICSNSTDCGRILGDSVVLIGYEQGDDIGYPVSQGKSIEEVKTYVPFIIREIIQVAREVVQMGATRVVVAGSMPIGCSPYILTPLANRSISPLAYDLQGCLNSVNNLVISQNTDLGLAVTKLASQFPRANILFADIYAPVKTVITLTTGSNRLKACCGIGGKYNFNFQRFCGSPGVPACANPNKYFYWDGLHLTQQANERVERIIAPIFLPLLKCRLI